MRRNLGLFVSSADRARLAAIIADRNSPQEHVWRTEVVLLTSDRDGTNEIIRRTVTDGVDAPRRHRCAKVAVLRDRNRGGVRGKS